MAGPNANSPVSYRTITMDDLSACMRLKTLANWNQTEDDWRMFLETNPDGCFLAIAGDLPVGSIATVNYENQVAWIGMVLVDPAFRGRGIAGRLMLKAIEALDDCPTIKLDATPAGKRVYEKLGFEMEYSLVRFTVNALPAVEPAETKVHQLAPEDLMRLAELDREAFGANRSFLLKKIYDRAPGMAWALDGAAGGFALGRKGTHFDQIGPVVAKTVDDAQALIRAALAGCEGRAVLLDVADSQEKLKAWLLELGFAVERPFLRMYRGENALPGQPSQQFAIAGPEFG